MFLENDLVRIEFDLRTGGISSLFDKQRKYEYVRAPDRALLVRLMAPKGDRQYLHIDGASPETTVDCNRATLVFRQDGIEMTATLTLDGAELHTSLQITNNSPHIIEEVMFPWVRGIGPIERGSLVWPMFWKRRFDDVFGKDFGGDHHTWNEWTQKVCGRYPSHLTSAWCDYGNAEHGLGIEGRHADFSMMDFYLHKIVEKDLDPIRRTLDIVTTHPHRIKPGEVYVSSPVLVKLHQGDWHTVAAQHRDWLSTWIRKPDRPEKFAKSIGWHFFFMKHQDGLVLNTYEDLPRMAAASLEAGCPYLLLFGWQVGGHDNNYFYRYVPNPEWGGEEALKNAIRKCRAMGVELMPFFNGTLANIEMPEHREFGRRWEAKTRTGHPYYAGDWARHNYDAITRNRAMLHTEIAFCEEQREYFLESMKRIVQQYGFGNTQLDQISEKMLVDYNEDHVMTTPDRVYVDGLAELLPAVRRLIREVNPEGVMISECLNDFTGQWCDSSWDWNILLPFPEPILYTLPWLMGSHEIDAQEYDEANKAFAYKLHLDMKIDGGDAPITKYLEFARHVRSLAELRTRVAPYHCLADFIDQEGIDGAFPENVLVKVYHNAASHKIGIVFAETGGKSTQLTTSASWKPAGGNIIVESNQRGREAMPSDRELALDLLPYEVRVACIDL